VRTLSELRSKVDRLTGLVENVLNQQIPTFTLPKDVNLPVDNDAGLDMLEQRLKTDTTVRDHLVS
jgi:antitoxin component of RelBE/YafQ-DinJ toxin-antitoxin module